MRLRAASVNKWHWQLTFAGLLLVVVSGLAMTSAATNLHANLAWRHIQWIGIGLVIHWLVAKTDYRRWADASFFIYGVGLAALLLVEVTGVMRLGATRWLSVFGLSIQPAEMAKLGTVLWLSRYLAGHPAPLPLRQLGLSLLIAGPPILLVLFQPDLGSATIIGAIWLGMVIVSGVSSRFLILAAAAGVLASPLGWFVLKEYQRMRILVFLNPYVDPLGAGYTIIQSVIAIGSGGLFGRGWREGTQNQLNFLPEHHSDFIFSVIGEEWGFLGCLVVIFLFGWLLLSILQAAWHSSDPQGKLMAAGVFSWIAYQAVVNIGMVMGILPVVGVPLPFVSYGGSSMITLWIALGLVQSIWRSASE